MARPLSPSGHQADCSTESSVTPQRRRTDRAALANLGTAGAGKRVPGRSPGRAPVALTSREPDVRCGAAGGSEGGGRDSDRPAGAHPGLVTGQGWWPGAGGSPNFRPHPECCTDLGRGPGAAGVPGEVAGSRRGLEREGRGSGLGAARGVRAPPSPETPEARPGVAQGTRCPSMPAFRVGALTVCGAPSPCSLPWLGAGRSGIAGTQQGFVLFPCHCWCQFSPSVTYSCKRRLSLFALAVRERRAEFTGLPHGEASMQRASRPTFRFPLLIFNYSGWSVLCLWRV